MLGERFWRLMGAVVGPLLLCAAGTLLALWLMPSTRKVLEYLRKGTPGACKHDWVDPSLVLHAASAFHCAHCRRFITGLSSPAVCCQRCTTVVHTRCAARTETCSKVDSVEVAGQGASAALDHVWVRAVDVAPWDGQEPPCAVCAAPMQEDEYPSPASCRCVWCQRLAHLHCVSTPTSSPATARCDGGLAAPLLLRPEWVAPVLRRRGRGAGRAHRDRAASEDVGGSALLNAVATGRGAGGPSGTVAARDVVDWRVQGIPAGATVLLVFIHPGSGGQLGQRLLAQFRRCLHPLQVCDLRAEGGPHAALRRFRLLAPALRVLACGGDGTVGWVAQGVRDTMPADAHRVPIAILPLGTGNDLARVLRWGAAYDGSSVPRVLAQAAAAIASPVDQWQVLIHAAPAAPQGAAAAAAAAAAVAGKRVGTLGRRLVRGALRRRRGTAGPPGGLPAEGAEGVDPGEAVAAAAVGEGRRLFMTNYCGLGCGARVVLRFHQLREERPHWFVHQLVNKVVYGHAGVAESLVRSCAGFADRVSLVADGQPVPLPETLEGIIVVNIPSYGAGMDLWASAQTPEGDAASARWGPQSVRDGRLEVVGVTGSDHLGRIQLGLSAPVALAQCETLEITTTEVRAPAAPQGSAS